MTSVMKRACILKPYFSEVLGEFWSFIRTTVWFRERRDVDLP
jgi:hypothetical protein